MFIQINVLSPPEKILFLIINLQQYILLVILTIIQIVFSKEDMKLLQEMNKN